MSGEQLAMIICGGRLAGLACAIRLKQLGIDALVLEQSRLPQSKLCGEFLAPETVACLQELGVLERVQAEAYGPVEAIRFYNQNGVALNVQTRWVRQDYPFALALPRKRLDDILLHAARKLGVEVLEESRVLGCLENSDGFTLTVERCGEPQTFYCRYLVDASGRNSPFVEAAPQRNGGMVGLQCHAKLPRSVSSKDLSMFLFEGGYGGIQPIDDRIVNLCVLVEKALTRQAASGFDAFLKTTLGKNAIAARQLEGAVITEKLFSTFVHNMDWRVGKKAYLHIGDALLTVDPFTGLGMAHALKTGCLSAEIICTGLERKESYALLTKRYYQAYQRLFGAHLKAIYLLRETLKFPFAQGMLWRMLPPFLPALAQLYGWPASK